MEEISLVLADADVERRIELKKALFKNPDIEIAGEVEDEDDCVATVKDEQPDLLILSIPFGDSDAAELVETVSVESPQTEIILIAEKMDDRDEARTLMRHGARDYIVRPVDEDELLQVLKEVVSVSRKRQEKLTQIMTGRASGQSTRPGKMISVFSTKGGVGRSLIAVNLACAIRELTEKRVVVVDFDLQFGDDAILLDMTPTTSIGEMARDATDQESIDLELLERYTHTHESSGIDLLPAPPRPEEADYVSDSEARHILEALKRHYEYIIVDTSSQVTEPVIAALEQSDLVLLLLTLELPTIKNGKLMLELMESLGLDRDFVRIIMNRDQPGSEIQLKEVEDALEQEIIGGLPSEGDIVMPSIDKGVPVILSHPDSEFSGRMFELARTIIRDELDLEDELLEEEEDTSVQPAGGMPGEPLEVGQRLLSGLLDHAIGYGGWGLFFIPGVAIAIAWGTPAMTAVGTLLALSGALVPIVYLTYFHAMSQSVGLRVADARIVTSENQPPTLTGALTRTLVELVLPGISHLFLFFDDQGQGLHDRIAGTYLIEDQDGS
jgi:pilus assembly protein CpaE